MDFGTILGDAVREAIGFNAAYYAILALGLNVHFGYTGLLNFGQVGFALTGAYSMGVVVVTWGQSMWLGLLFAIGMIGFVVRRNMIVVFLCAEMMLQGVSISLVAWGRYHMDWGGQMLVLFIIAVAAKPGDTAVMNVSSNEPG